MLLLYRLCPNESSCSGKPPGVCHKLVNDTGGWRLEFLGFLRGEGRQAAFLAQAFVGASPVCSRGVSGSVGAEARLVPGPGDWKKVAVATKNLLVGKLVAA